uniref:Peptidylglycine monooxygenase n=1 Tax=Mesocestoides corti TaxID=53468 RepID=A0A5K3EQ04_MESCO
MGDLLVYFAAFLLSINSVISEKVLVSMPGAYPQKADDYICTQIPLPQFKNSPGYVTAFKPIVNASVHHIILGACDKWIGRNKASRPGPCINTCRTHILYAWAHKGAPLVLPEGSAFEIGRGTQIQSLSMEVHYSRREENPDFASIELTYTREPQPNRAGVILLYNDEATIPPHSEHFPTNISCRLRTEVPIRVFGIRTHAHDLNKGVYGYYLRPGDRNYHLLAKGNAQWPQTFYRPTQLSASTDSIRLEDGDILMARCVYDSTDRDKPTSMGSTHADEMCNMYLMYTIDANYELPAESEMCVDDMVPGVWDHAPPESVDYVTNVPPSPNSMPETSPASTPRFIDFLFDRKWSVEDVHLGSVTGIGMTADDDGKTHLFILRRGDNPWEENSFDRDYRYRESNIESVPSPILHVDAETGEVVEAFGDDLFVLPHGLSVARGAKGEPVALWVTDVALHQAMKFDWGKWKKPSMVLGRRAEPGDDGNSFCQPTDVAVASTGEIFVADGYCNQRIVKFSARGDYVSEWGVRGADTESNRGFLVAHSLAIIPASESGAVEQVCVADRERAQVDCYDLQGRRVAQYGGRALQPSVYAITFSPAHNLMFGVTGPANASMSALERLQALLALGVDEDDADVVGGRGNRAFAFLPLLSANGFDPGLGFYKRLTRHNILDLEFQRPHDIEVSPDGTMLFVAQLKKPYLSKIDIVKSAKVAALHQAATASTGNPAPNFTMPPRTLTQKIFITGALVTLCAVVVLIVLILFRSRRNAPWAFRNRAFWPNRPRGRMATGRGGQKRYDGFQPLHRDELQGLGSMCESDEDSDEDAGADSNAIIDIRKFGPSSSRQTLLPSAPPHPKPNTSLSSSHHIET